MNWVSLLKALGLVQTECIACQREGHFVEQGYICGDCIKSIKPHHPIDYVHIDYLSSYRVFGIYDGVLMHAIRSIKFDLNKPLTKRLGEIIKPYLWDYIGQVNPDYVTYPPLNLTRFWTRGFNHAELILRHAGVTPVELFVRKGYHKPMALMSKEERKEAVEMFRLRKGTLDLVENKVILIFDDIITTGTTISHLAKLLLMAGALEVHAFFVAKDV